MLVPTAVLAELVTLATCGASRVAVFVTLNVLFVLIASLFLRLVVKSTVNINPEPVESASA